MSEFEPLVYGQPDPKMSRDGIDRIIADAKANGQNVFFGDGWRHPRQELSISYMTQAPVEMGFWKSLAASVFGWL